mmetsp:Transcript_20526/g.25373  ORF Transcript_20526/g.25373 Transcript_20526/m.25373 type:complete len:838 (-) Transcript_20526:28-2541(-)|eukprot:CAMPEP_0172503638 /NCGR_PEP_ID=MMETSP1066-20121228/171024_1 /TAXON_ID=671091 /ORGANISM="Coscinodiscus wailesii, Strain CCMP2513" /LENGTH=837 /DNA_ID=CAMNT_0013279449 /DNA_START=41 /DNA_END=2554 /DNA_ORIENTATION=-
MPRIKKKQKRKVLLPHNQRRRAAEEGGVVTGSLSSSKGVLKNCPVLQEFNVDDDPDDRALFVGVVIDYMPPSSRRKRDPLLEYHFYRIRFLDGDVQDYSPSETWNMVVAYHNQRMLRSSMSGISSSSRELYHDVRKRDVWAKLSRESGEAVSAEDDLMKTGIPLTRSDIRLLDSERNGYWRFWGHEEMYNDRLRGTVKEETGNEILKDMLVKCEPRKKQREYIRHAERDSKTGKYIKRSTTTSSDTDSLNNSKKHKEDNNGEASKTSDEKDIRHRDSKDKYKKRSAPTPSDTDRSKSRKKHKGDKKFEATKKSNELHIPREATTPSRSQSPKECPAPYIASSDEWLTPTSERFLERSSSSSHDGIYGLRDRELIFDGMRIILSIHQSTIKNAGYGLFLTFEGPVNDNVSGGDDDGYDGGDDSCCSAATTTTTRWKTSAFCDLGRYGPLCAADIKSRVAMEMKNFFFEEAPSDWSYKGPTKSSVVLDAPPARVEGGVEDAYEVTSTAAEKKLFGKVITENCVFDITSDDTGALTDDAKRRLLPFCNERRGGKSSDRYNVSNIHHKDGSLHYVLNPDLIFHRGKKVELFVDYGKEYDSVRKRKQEYSLVPGADYTTTSDTSSGVCGSAAAHADCNYYCSSCYRCGEIKTRNIRRHRIVPHYTNIWRCISSYTEKDVEDVLDYIIASPPEPSRARQRMFWVVEQLRDFCKQLLYDQCGGVIPERIDEKIEQAMTLFPRTGKFRRQDCKVERKCEFLGRCVKKNDAVFGRMVGMVERLLPSNDDDNDDDCDDSFDEASRRYTVVFFNGIEEEMDEETVQESTFANFYGLYINTVTFKGYNN